mmetsp:Transcript_12129/g.16530  ORF Transcript_12129/g.16530 Transcript_12129/m.16530 type:complete len:237 (-) Transcript_12129:1121-1831(-)
MSVMGGLGWGEESPLCLHFHKQVTQIQSCTPTTRVTTAHHVHKLIVVDAPVIVLINLCDDIFYVFDIHAVLHQRIPQLVGRDETRVIRVKGCKGLPEVFFRVQFVHMQGGCDELLIGEVPVSVDVYRAHDSLHLCLRHGVAHFLQPFLQLRQSNGARVVSIEALEELFETLDLEGAHVLGDDVESHLLEAVHAGELLQPCQHSVVQWVVWSIAVLTHPWVVQRLLSCHSLFRVDNK